MQAGLHHGRRRRGLPVCPGLYAGLRRTVLRLRIQKTVLKGESYEEENVIYDDLKFKVTVPTPNQETVSVNLNTGFINDLNNDFKVTIPESYYEINETDITEEIKIKASTIPAFKPGKALKEKVNK